MSLDELADTLADKVGTAIARLEARMKALIEAGAVRSALIDREGALVLTFGDGTSRNVGRVVGHDGAPGTDGDPGKNGLDGLGIADLDVTLDPDGRTLDLRFERDELVETFQLELPVMLYRGVYDHERGYRPGDCVTYGGSIWVCGEPTTSRPGEGLGWTLAVKRGRDGKGQG